MVELPPEYVVDGTLEVGTIYRIQAEELIVTNVPHYFIAVLIDEEDIYTLKCTSQRKTIEKHFENFNLDFSGLICIKPDKENKLHKITYVNCHNSYDFTKFTLVRKRKDGLLKYIGKVGLNHWLQILNGIKQSKTNNLPKHLLEHPDE